MKQEVLDTLMDNEIVTVVGVEAEKYEDLDALKENGLATSIAADEIYEMATSEESIDGPTLEGTIFTEEDEE